MAEEDTSTPYAGECIDSDENFDASLFSKKELGVLQEIIQRFSECSSTDMMKLSYAETAYQKTNMQEKMSFAYALDLKGIN